MEEPWKINFGSDQARFSLLFLEPTDFQAPRPVGAEAAA